MTVRPLFGAALLLLTPLGGAAAPPAGAPPDPARQAELRHLLRHDCGSCHGMRLMGGLGPPLNPERMRAFPPEFLAATILQGRPGTPMPPWGPILREAEVRWLVEELQRGVQP